RPEFLVLQVRIHSRKGACHGCVLPGSQKNHGVVAGPAPVSGPRIRGPGSIRPRRVPPPPGGLPRPAGSTFYPERGRLRQGVAAESPAACVSPRPSEPEASARGEVSLADASGSDNDASRILLAEPVAHW